MSTPTEPQIVLRPRAFNQSLQFWWAAPLNDGGSPITGYVLECAAIAYSQPIVDTSGTYLVTGLTNGTDYTFTIYATNTNGNGAVATFRTVQPCTQIGAPTAVSATIVSTISTATVSWTNPMGLGGGTHRYNNVRASPQDLTGSIIKGLLPEQTSATLSGLDPYKAYRFQARSFNDAGWSHEEQALTSSFYFISTPKDISGLRLWLDGGDIATMYTDLAGTSPVTKFGDRVTLWKDKSTHSNHFNARTITHPFYGLNAPAETKTYTGPTYEPDAIQFKGATPQSGPYFQTDTQALLSQSNLALTPNNRITAFVVGQHREAGANETFPLVLPNVSSGVYTGTFTAAIQNIEYGGYDTMNTILGEVAIASRELNLFTQNPFVKTILSDTSTATSYLSSWMAYQTGVPAVTVPFTSNISTSQVYGLGWTLSTPGSNNQAITEVVVYDRDLSIGEQSTITTYLNKKWGLFQGDGDFTLAIAYLGGNVYQAITTNTHFNYKLAEWLVDDVVVATHSFTYDASGAGGGPHTLVFNLYTLAGNTYSDTTNFSI